MRSLTPRQWTGIALAAVALPALAATAWPLITFLRGLLPSDLPVGRILLGAGLAVVLVIAAVLIRAQRRTSVRLWWLIITAWAVAISAVAAMALLTWLALGLPRLDPPSELSPRALDAIATRSFAVVAGLGGVALLVIHYRRQRTTENGEQREVTKLFNERFTAAYTELGSEHAAVRLGAVHALAYLADDAPEGREDLVQMVIDVLCAYLRMPYAPDPDPLPKNASRERREEHRKYELEFAALREVRHTIIRIIGNRLSEPTRWRGKEYDFSDVVFDGGDLSRAHFTSGGVSFNGAEFTGGMVDFRGARFTGGRVFFAGARFTGGRVLFGGAEFTSGLVLFSEVEFTGGRVFFVGARFTGGRVFFGGAEFTGGDVSFLGARFTGGTVDFQAASGQCPAYLLKAVQSGEPGVVVLPDEWQPNRIGDEEETAMGSPSDAPDH